LLDSGFDHFIKQRSRDDDCAVIVGDDDVIRKHCSSAAADGHLPAYKRQTRYGRRRCSPLAPDREIGAKHSGEIADDPIRDEAGHSANTDALAKDVAEDAGVKARSAA
jgi:hypothetical protein